jgi:hypothetical protein
MILTVGHSTSPRKPFQSIITRGLVLRADKVIE